MYSALRSVLNVKHNVVANLFTIREELSRMQPPQHWSMCPPKRAADIKCIVSRFCFQNRIEIMRKAQLTNHFNFEYAKEIGLVYCEG